MKKHHVVIIGSGFGGLFAAQGLRNADVDVTVIAKTTHHLFQPLLYQVATGILSEGAIAPSTREVLKRQRNVTVLTGLVTDIDLDNRTVRHRFHESESVTGYDSLIVAAGAGQSYFGNDQFATFAPGMKTIDDALELRARIFWAFERAELTDDPDERRRMLTFVVVGAGPTGVEMAGQIAELANTTLRGQFREIDSSSARVLLIDAAPQVLPPFGPKLGRATQRSLERSGVEVILNSPVVDMDADSVTYRSPDGTDHTVAAACKVWAAGVQGNDLGRTVAEQSGAELDKAGRVVVEPDMSVPGHPEVTVIGDLAFREGVPGVAQGAIQQAKYVTSRIADRAAGRPTDDRPFSYFDRGSMATISKYSAVVKVGKLELTGFIAWVMWLALHLLYIAGFKNRVTTLLHWAISFISNGRTERATTNQQLVGRLALEQLGQRVTGRLLRGQRIESEEPRRQP
ncbi:NAD(P)/FAD-dependent oxidoreductase [Enemella sp. A6]|uniref:NAD(P)/FAD-dependent oxidoreductase n=1 Tax=Enemella sp. A6 TaxID=3440152 RepID=UPI003EBF9AB6